MKNEIESVIVFGSASTGTNGVHSRLCVAFTIHEGQANRRPFRSRLLCFGVSFRKKKTAFLLLRWTARFNSNEKIVRIELE